MASRSSVFSVVHLALVILATSSLFAQMHFAKGATYDSGGPFADSVAIADLNGDGKPDLVVTNDCQSAPFGSCAASGEVAVLLGKGDGTFQPAVPYSTGAYYADSVAIGDVNGDGKPDLVIANLCTTLQGGFECANLSPGGVSVLLGNGDGTFQPPVIYDSGGAYSNSVVIGDVNGDKTLDLVVANGCEKTNCLNGSVSVLLGNGDGTFRSAVSYNSGGFDADSVVIADANGDRHPDLLVANLCQSESCDPSDGEVGVLLGNGDGTFQPVVTYNSGGNGAYSVTVADLRGKQIQDLVVANRFDIAGGAKRGAMGVLLGNGDGTFQPAVSYLSAGAAIDSVTVRDVSGDGILDLVVIEECQTLQLGVCVGTGEINVMLGYGDGTFQLPIKYSSGGYEGSAIAVGDLNRDGRPDIVVTNACGSDRSCSSGDGSAVVKLNKTSYKTTTVLTSLPNPSQVNQVITLTATVSSSLAVPNGEFVTFYAGSTKLGKATTNNGVATLTTSFSKANTYTLKAKYSGDTWHKPSYGTASQVVNP